MPAWCAAPLHELGRVERPGRRVLHVGLGTELVLHADLLLRDVHEPVQRRRVGLDHVVGHVVDFRVAAAVDRLDPVGETVTVGVDVVLRDPELLLHPDDQVLGALLSVGGVAVEILHRG